MKVLVTNKVLLVFLIITALLLLASFFLVYLNIDNLSYPLILHFNPYRGVDVTGESANLWGIVGMGALVIVLNIFLGSTLFYRERVLAYVMLAANMLIGLLMLISVANIVSLN